MHMPIYLERELTSCSEVATAYILELWYNHVVMLLPPKECQIMLQIVNRQNLVYFFNYVNNYAIICRCRTNAG